MSNTINLDELESIITEFAERKQYGYKKDTVKNLFIKKNKQKEYEAQSFIAVLRKMCSGCTNVVGQDEYAATVRHVVKSYTSSKETAIDLIKRLTSDIEKKSGCCFEIEYPPIPTNSTFERLMYISKYLQNPTAKISDLEDILWISSRTIDSDLLKLRGMDDDPIQICGKKYVLDDITRENDHVRDIASTPHPLFLTCNITQVIILLKGLKEMSVEPAFHGYAMKTACEIWEQLSCIAKDRILYVTKYLMPDEGKWFQELSTLGDNTFWPEYRCSSHASNAIIECLKNKFPCYIEYKTDEGTKFFEAVQIKAYYGDIVKIIMDGEECELKMENVVRSATNPEFLF